MAVRFQNILEFEQHLVLNLEMKYSALFPVFCTGGRQKNMKVGGKKTNKQTQTKT